MDHTVDQMSKTLLGIWFKKCETLTKDPSIKILVNKTENKIAFKIKSGFHLELLTPETMKLIWNTENKIKKIKMFKMYLI